jgi:Rieske 2Fe-2S family protein
MPAPIDPAKLMPVLRPFGESRVLPRDAYVDPDVFAWEQENFLRRRWICTARSEELPSPGDQRAVRIGAETALLVRGADGVLRAFSNVCRHRGHELLPCDASTNGRAIVCPYHAWGYGLDGSLKAAPNFRDVAAFDRTEFPLLTLACAEWHGYVFVNASGDAGPLSDQLGDLDRIIAPYDIASLVTLAKHDYVVDSNWKVLSENYNECYHCPTIHPELCAVSPPDSGYDYEGEGSWVGGSMWLVDGAQTMSLDGKSHGDPIPGVSTHERPTVGYIDVFPNLLISVHPDYVMTHKLTPLGPGATHIECTWAFPQSSARRPGFDPSYAVDFWDITNRQDWNACEGVQRGLTAREWTPGPIAPEETAVYEFDVLVAHGYLDHPLHTERTHTRSAVNAE